MEKEVRKEARKEVKNEMTLEFDAISANEGFARVAVAAFITPLNPTLEEVADVKTALSEAVTNAIIHGYEEKEGKVKVCCLLEKDRLTVEVKDEGKGIKDVVQAMEPLFTTRPELERSGMGFAFMEAFMDELEVESAVGKGTTVRMKKKLGTESYLDDEE